MAYQSSLKTYNSDYNHMFVCVLCIVPVCITASESLTEKINSGQRSNIRVDSVYLEASSTT